MSTVVCPVCKGSKKMIMFGGLLMDCDHCDLAGYIDLKEYEEKNNDEDLVSKYKRSKPKKNIKDE